MIYGLFLCVMLACQNSNHPKIIAMAWDMVSICSNPDSALNLLQQIDFPDELKEKDIAAYALTLTRIHGCKGISMAEDSLILFAVDYYGKVRDTVRLLEACKLAAEYYIWKEQPELVADTYDKAIVIAKELNDSAQIAFCFADKGNYLIQRKQYEKAYQAYSQSLLYSPAHVSYYHCAICKSAMNSDSVDYYIEKGVELALQQKDTLFACHYLRNYASMLIERGLLDEAVKQIRRTYTLSDYYKDFIGNHMVMAEIFLTRHNLDSAQYYLDRAKETRYKTSLGGMATKENFSLKNWISTMQTTITYARTGIYPDEDKGYNDSILNNIQLHNKIILGQMEAQNTLQTRYLKLKIEKQRTGNRIWLAGFVFVMLSGILWLYNRNRQIKLMEAEERIETLNRMLADTEKNGNSDSTDNTFVKKMLLKQLGIIRLAASSPSVQNRELIRQIAEIGNQDIPAEGIINWNELYPLIDNVYDHFYTRLMNQFGNLLIDKEIQLCCLLRAGFSTKEISIVTRQSTHTIYQRKTAIRKKVKMDEKTDIIDFFRQKIVPH